MTDLDFLNQLASSVEAEESPTVFEQHPCGRFRGTINNVTQKTVNDRPVWEIFIKTAKGLVNHSRWGFSHEDLMKAQQSQNDRDNMMSSIRRLKRLFVDCKVWSHEESNSKSWNDILGGFSELIGKTCEVVVKPDTRANKAGYVISFVNEDLNREDIVDQLQPNPAARHAATNSGENPAIPGARRPAGMGSDLNGIPF